ncbi:hypothetical protein HYV81_01330 [Candidatus Woesearchaeota archaeon]|nr:hypothetical protein [Candidatus Woesearchaeota archaeon]
MRKDSPAKRVILDTNIYGRILEEFHQKVIREAVDRGVLKGHFIIYGFDVIRKELRATSRKTIIGNEKVRLTVLNFYDLLVGNHTLVIDQEMKDLAGKYYKVYKELGGSSKEHEILNDFIIVAGSSMKNFDIIYSEDNKTMASETAVKSYKIVNGLNNIRTPYFEDYTKFIKEIRRLLS